MRWPSDPLWGWSQSRARGEVTAAALAPAKATYDQEFTTAAETNNPLGLFATVAHGGRQPADRARFNPVADAGAHDPRDALHVQCRHEGVQGSVHEGLQAQRRVSNADPGHPRQLRHVTTHPMINKASLV